MHVHLPSWQSSRFSEQRLVRITEVDNSSWKRTYLKIQKISRHENSIIKWQDSLPREHTDVMQHSRPKITTFRCAPSIFGTHSGSRQSYSIAQPTFSLNKDNKIILVPFYIRLLPPPKKEYKHHHQKIWLQRRTKIIQHAHTLTCWGRGTSRGALATGTREQQRVIFNFKVVPCSK